MCAHFCDVWLKLRINTFLLFLQMRLANFIIDNLDFILARWHDLSQDRTVSPGGHEVRIQLLQAISAQLRGPTPPRAPAAQESAPSSAYGAERLLSGASVDALIADMHALRASILTLWREQGEVPDLDEVLRLNHAIDQAEAEAVARFSAMMQHAQQLFLAILGHDLRNPLNTTVMGASFLMRAPGIAQGHADVAARIHRSGIRMGRLVEDLLDYTRINLGSPLPMTLTKCNMGSICRSAMEELRLSNPERVFQLAHDGDLDGVWDEGRIAQVFSNLLGNAVQHGARGEPVNMRIDSGGNELVIHIHNSGTPIDAQALAAIFDPLVRFADPRASRSGAGSSLGIGLYIARAIVEAHGGDIRVNSHAQTGTVFSVRLPRIPRTVPAASR